MKSNNLLTALLNNAGVLNPCEAWWFAELLQMQRMGGAK